MSGQSGDHRDRKSYRITAAVKSDLCAGWEGWSGRVEGGLRPPGLFNYDRPCWIGSLVSLQIFYCS